MLYGSPPRARGHAVQTPSTSQDARFTPACAGTWSAQRITSHIHPVHPRVRGDMDRPDRGSQPLTGSPPRARGHGAGHGLIHGPTRFTPACAGTWRSPARSRRSRPVHPRVRGDMFEESAGFAPPPRFTPACAGTCRWAARRRRFRPVHPRVRGDMGYSGSSSLRIDGSPPRARGHDEPISKVS